MVSSITIIKKQTDKRTNKHTNVISINSKEFMFLILHFITRSEDEEDFMPGPFVEEFIPAPFMVRHTQ